MMIYNQEMTSLKELREKYHLVSKWQVSVLAHCRNSVIDKISEKYKVEKQILEVNGKSCIFYDESIIDLINKNKPQGSKTIPENYITRKELAKYLNVSLGTLSDIEFWCWDFKNYKKTLIVNRASVICYEFTPEAKNFYDRKIYKWRNPDRKHGTCWQR